MWCALTSGKMYISVTVSLLRCKFLRSYANMLITNVFFVKIKCTFAPSKKRRWLLLETLLLLPT